MGNVEAREDPQAQAAVVSAAVPAKGVAGVRSVAPQPQCALADEDEMRALRAMTVVRPVNAKVLNSDFMARARAAAPCPMDVRPLMLMIWDYHTHVRERAGEAAAQQERTLAQLAASEQAVADALKTLATHASVIGTFTEAARGLDSVDALARDTAIRASYAQEAAERLDRVMQLVEGEIEIDHPNALAAVSASPSPELPPDTLTALADERLAFVSPM